MTTKVQGKQKQSLRAAKAKKTKVRKVVWIGGGEEAADKLRDAEGRRSRQRNLVDVRASDATLADRQLLEEVEAEVEALRQGLRDSSIKFVLEAVGRKRYDKILESHPPTAEQLAKAEVDGEASAGFDPETFVYALIDACVVEPESEPGELEAWLRDDPDEEWSNAEVRDLFNAALEVNLSRPTYNLGKE